MANKKNGVLISAITISFLVSCGSENSVFHRDSVHYTNVDKIWSSEHLEFAQLKPKLFKNLSAIKTMDVDAVSRVPLLSHLVWITNTENPTEYREKDFERLEKKIALFNTGKHPWKFLLWTNVGEQSIPKTSEKCSKLGVEIRNTDTLKSPLRKILSSLAKRKKGVIASDIIRIVIVKEQGGVYADNDYEFYSTLDVLLGNFDSIVAFNSSDGDPLLVGNAFIAAVSEHPILQDAHQLLMRNVFGVQIDGQEIPKYVTNPSNLFSQVIMSTGPIVLTLALQKAINTAGKRDLVLPYGVIFMSWASKMDVYSKDKLPLCREEKTGYLLPGNCSDPFFFPVIGNDDYQGSWYNSDSHKPLTEYPVPFLGKDL